MFAEDNTCNRPLPILTGKTMEYGCRPRRGHLEHCSVAGDATYLGCSIHIALRVSEENIVGGIGPVRRVRKGVQNRLRITLGVGDPARDRLQHNQNHENDRGYCSFANSGEEVTEAIHNSSAFIGECRQQEIQDTCEREGCLGRCHRLTFLEGAGPAVL